MSLHDLQSDLRANNPGIQTAISSSGYVLSIKNQAGTTRQTISFSNGVFTLGVLTTDEDCRGKGDARKLLTSSLLSADKLGIPTKMDAGDPTNGEGAAAIARLVETYKRFGFVVTNATNPSNPSSSSALVPMTRAVGATILPSRGIQFTIAQPSPAAVSLPPKTKQRTLTDQIKDVFTR